MAKTDNLIRASDFAVFIKGMRGDWVAHPDTGRIYSNCSRDFLNPSIKRNGYAAIKVRFRLSDTDYRGDIYLHRAMWILCRGIPTSLSAEVDHIDRNRQNNRLENLRLVFKDENRCRKLSYADAEDIRRRHAAGETQRTLAKAYDISKSSISDIIRKETYKNPPTAMHSGRI